MIIAMLLAAAAPSAEALTLGRQIAEAGTLGTILPLMQSKETDELVAAHPELSATDKAALKATAKAVYDQGFERIMDAEGRALAERLSLDDLRGVVAFQSSAAGKTYKAAMPQVIAATMQSLGELHYKEDVAAAFCKQTGKLCAAKR